MPERLQTTTEALRASEERLQLALQAGGSGAWDWDLARDAAEVSPSYRELFGLAPDVAVTYEFWLSRVHPEDRERCRRYGEEFFAGRDTDWRLRFRIVRGDGEVRWHRAIGKVYRDAAGKPLRFVGVSTDVTEEQRALAALSESEARFRAMADGLPLIVWVHDAQGAQQFVNRTFLEYFEVGEEEMKGGRWQLLMHPDDGPAYAQDFMACVRERKPFHAEVRVRNGKGEWRNIESWGRPRWSAAGEYLGMVGTSADVTERRRIEQALRDADRHKDEFLAVLGHELRNPLAVVSLTLDNFRLGLPADSPLAPARDAAERQVKILIRLVDDLLDSARISTGKIALKRSRLALRGMVLSALETSRLDLQAKRHQLVVEEAGGELEVEGDEVRLVQVVSNLLNNAARYTPEGGRIVVSLAREGEHAVLRVRDNGIGIEPRRLGSVFELFVQGHEQARARGAGLGLGLSLVKKLVELHGGSVAALSEGPGRGAEFVVRLPLAGGAKLAPAAKAPLPVTGGRRVLVVDDNRDAAGSLAMLVGALGHEVRQAYTGASALEAVPSFRPDLIVLDVGLPDMDGYETARRIRQVPGGREARIVAASGYGELAGAAREAGMDAYFVKPLQLAELEQALSLPSAAAGRSASSG
jgi:PAS domain S-box-containing protein